MTSGINHIAPDEKHPSVVKLKLDTTRDIKEGRIDVGGICIAAKDFGAHPTLRLSTAKGDIDLAFKADETPRRQKRFAKLSLNALACEIQQFSVHEADVPATLLLTSEDGTQEAVLAQFDAHPVEQIHDQLVRQVEQNAIDIDALDLALASLPEDSRKSDEGQLMAAVLNIMRHGYEGTGEAELRAMRRIYRSRERFLMYPRYIDLLNLAIAPVVYGNHGLTQKFADMELTQDFWSALNDFLAFLDAEFGPSFLVSGSLLGLIREGQLLPHDDDLDIAIVLPANNAAEAAEQWNGVKQRLIEKGMLNEGMTATARLPLLKSIRIEGVPTDLFPAWLEGEKVFVFPHTFGELDRADVLPLVPEKQFNVPIPRCPEKMLEINYGASWRTPDPNAKLDWPRWNKNYRAFIKSKVFSDWQA